MTEQIELMGLQPILPGDVVERVECDEPHHWEVHGGVLYLWTLGPPLPLVHYTVHTRRP